MLTSVPVSTLTRTAISSAWSLRSTPDGTAIVPEIAAGAAGAATTGTSTLTAGPPVMTGTGSAVFSSVAPSTIDARIAYELLGLMPASSYGTANAAGRLVT